MISQDTPRLTLISTSVLAAAWFAASSTFAADPPVPADAKLKEEVRVAFTEGPAWHPSGNVYFSDIVNDRIMRRDPKGELHVFRTPSGRTNGNLFDLEGRLVCCEGGGLGSNRRVTRIEHDGTITVLADNYRGKKFNSPNDLTIDSRGRIYFSDPRYGDRSGIEQLDDAGREIEGVYRIDAPGKVKQVITHEADRPNGVFVSPGDEFLYVADNVNDGPRGQGGNRKLWRFDLHGDGSVVLDSRKLIFDWGTDRGPDGMAMDVEGRLQLPQAAGRNGREVQGGRVRDFARGEAARLHRRADRHGHQLHVRRRRPEDAVYYGRAQAVEHPGQHAGVSPLARGRRMTNGSEARNPKHQIRNKFK
jgi:gluconolactonase